MKLEINRKTSGKITKQRVNNVFLKNKCVNKEIKEKLRKYLETNKNGNITFQKVGEMLQEQF